MIHTKIHNLREILIKGTHNGTVQSQRMLKILSGAVAEFNHFVLTPELLSTVSRKDAMDTVDALYQVNQVHLPFPDMIVEFDLPMTNDDGSVSTQRAFFIYYEQDNVIHCYAAYLVRNQAVGGMVAPVHVRLVDADAVPENENRHFQFMVDGGEDGERESVVWLLSILTYIYTLTYTRGVRREQVTSDQLRKLNKARAAHKKLPITPYTVFHIGKVYDTKGASTTWHPGTKMRPHLRSGHVRQQACGVGRKDHKLVFIEPLLVNCTSRDEIDRKPRVVTR